MAGAMRGEVLEPRKPDSLDELKKNTRVSSACMKHRVQGQSCARLCEPYSELSKSSRKPLKNIVK